MARGVVAALGHTEASYEITKTVIAAGPGSRPICSTSCGRSISDPGPITALLEDPRATLELVLDGSIWHPAIYRLVTRAVTEIRLEPDAALLRAVRQTSANPARALG
jgi:N-acetylglucosamine-6-phosphate deacetylase